MKNIAGTRREKKPKQKQLSSLVRPVGIIVGMTCPRKLSHFAQCDPTGMVKNNMAGTEQITDCLIIHLQIQFVLGIQK